MVGTPTSIYCIMVKIFYLFNEFAPGIVAALQEFVEGRRKITEVLPSLPNISVIKPSGPFQVNIGQFIASRQLSGHPIIL